MLEKRNLIKPFSFQATQQSILESRSQDCISGSYFNLAALFLTTYEREWNQASIEQWDSAVSVSKTKTKRHCLKIEHYVGIKIIYLNKTRRIQ